MYIRALFKQVARSALSGRYAQAMLVTAFFAVIPLILYFTKASMVIDLTMLLVMGPLTLALTRFCLFIIEGRQTDAGDFFGGLTYWSNGLLAYLWQSLWIGLWFLLLIVPGIIKAVSYSMQFYLLADYPNLTARQSLTLSKKLTEGYKWELFVTICSFWGWLLLSILTFGLALVYVIPYYYTTMGAIYVFLKEKALIDGRINPDELPDTITEQATESAATTDQPDCETDPPFVQAIIDDISAEYAPSAFARLAPEEATDIAAVDAAEEASEPLLAAVEPPSADEASLTDSILSAKERDPHEQQ